MEVRCRFPSAQIVGSNEIKATTVNDVRPGEALEEKYGYLPEDGKYGCCNPHNQVSSLQEYDNADFALSRFAAALGDSSNAAKMQDRANNWVNVFNTSTGLLTPRLTNGAATKLGFLGSAYNAGTDGSSGTATITYTDGSSSTATLGFSIWTLSAGNGTPLFDNVIVASTPYRNHTSGRDQVKTYVFAETLPITSGKMVASVTLPASLGQGSIGVFAIAAG